MRPAQLCDLRPRCGGWTVDFANVGCCHMKRLAATPGRNRCCKSCERVAAGESSGITHHLLYLGVHDIVGQTFEAVCRRGYMNPEVRKIGH